MTPVKHHYIDIYHNQNSLKIGEEMHIVYLREQVQELAKGERLRLIYDGWIHVDNIERFDPDVRSVVEKNEFYSKGDRLSVNMELGYIEKCLTRIFTDKLRKTELQQKINDKLYLLKGAVFYLTERVLSIPGIDLPHFPMKEPDIQFSPTGPERCVFFPETEKKSK